ncbi:DUF2986 domain-containing protein [Oceanospirillaceae bacterium]|jgi:hypothetical protein|uniref:DUF2986 domain-containing protein n=1 Tax=Candidatus Njordibacter sp. Uisw_002 TaxID=3230971 RepID=UPI00237350C1|nr:DUF2986 domain-containing protein [Oceanospirillaceae bacterium]|tara:strand:- start:3145 stop:3333 length:189 start_codon:yes stop_codon:yes gene_type:complete
MAKLITEQTQMNRRKKGVQILKAQAKKHNAKSSTKVKPKYISKAQRAKLEMGAIDENASVAI